MAIPTRVTIGPLARPLQRVVQLQRTRGTARTCFAVAKRLAGLPLLRNFVHLCAVDIWEMPLDTSGPAPRTSSLFTVRFAQHADLPDLADYFGDRTLVEERLARGHRCLVAYSREAIGAAVWLVIGPGQFDEDWSDLHSVLRFPDGVLFTYDGKGTKLGAWGTMMRRMPQLLAEEDSLADKDIEQIATIIDCNNWQSIDAHRSLGYASRGVLLHARVLGCPLRRFKPPQQRWRRVPPSVGRVEVAKHRGTV